MSLGVFEGEEHIQTRASKKTLLYVHTYAVLAVSLYLAFI